jgi:hypothetical protein
MQLIVIWMPNRTVETRDAQELANGTCIELLLAENHITSAEVGSHRETHYGAQAAREIGHCQNSKGSPIPQGASLVMGLRD